MIELRKIDRNHPDAAAAACINDEAFPPLEHIDMEQLFTINEKTDAEILGFYSGDQLIGFLWSIFNTRCAYIFFLAIGEKYRGMGYGTQTIPEIFRYYADRQVVLDMEELVPSADNYTQRVRRKAFYLRCGFHETGRYTLFEGERFEVVCNKGPLDTEGFLDIAVRIHHLMPNYPGVIL